MSQTKRGKISGFGVCVYKHRHMHAIVCIWRSEDSFRCWSLLLLCLNQVSVGFRVCFFLHLPGVLAHALQDFSCFHLLFFCIITGMTHTCPAASNLFKFVLAIDTQSYPLRHLSKPKKQFLLKILAFSLK